MKNHNFYISINDQNWSVKALKKISDDGVVVLRGIINDDDMQILKKKVDNVLSQPSVLGSVGYYQKDPYRKFYDGFLLGREVINVFVSEIIINFIETYLIGEVVINEIFLKNDLGNNLLYLPYHRHTGVGLENISQKPFGCGIALYIHDTEEGAFCYSIGSHNLNIEDKIDNIEDHPLKENLMNNLNRINGDAGDLIIFDERGFHGPEQPTKIPRKIILSGYQLSKCTKNRSRTAIPILISDLKDLSKKQMRCIGIGAGTRGKYEDYHLRTLNNNPVYETISSIITNKTNNIYSKAKFKRRLRSFIGKYLNKNLL